MYLYEKMVIESKGIPIDDGKSLGNFEGLCDNGVILTNKNLSETRKAEVSYEELTHHKSTYGNILDQSEWINRKFENYVRRHGFISAVLLREIVEAYNYGVRNLYELSEYLQLSEKYILEAIEQYKKICGIGTYYGEYLIIFEPLRVFKHEEIQQRGNENE